MNNSNLNFNSVETLPNLNAKATFQVDSSAHVFRNIKICSCVLMSNFVTNFGEGIKK